MKTWNEYLKEKALENSSDITEAFHPVLDALEKILGPRYEEFTNLKFGEGKPFYTQIMNQIGQMPPNAVKGTVVSNLAKQIISALDHVNNNNSSYQPYTDPNNKNVR